MGELEEKSPQEAIHLIEFGAEPQSRHLLLRAPAPPGDPAARMLLISNIHRLGPEDQKTYQGLSAETTQGAATGSREAAKGGLVDQAGLGSQRTGSGRFNRFGNPVANFIREARLSHDVTAYLSRHPDFEDAHRYLLDQGFEAVVKPQKIKSSLYQSKRILMFHPGQEGEVREVDQKKAVAAMGLSFVPVLYRKQGLDLRILTVPLEKTLMLGGEKTVFGGQAPASRKDIRVITGEKEVRQALFRMNGQVFLADRPADAEGLSIQTSFHVRSPEDARRLEESLVSNFDTLIDYDLYVTYGDSGQPAAVLVRERPFQGDKYFFGSEQQEIHDYLVELQAADARSEGGASDTQILDEGVLKQICDAYDYKISWEPDWDELFHSSRGEVLVVEIDRTPGGRTVVKKERVRDLAQRRYSMEKSGIFLARKTSLSGFGALQDSAIVIRLGGVQSILVDQDVLWNALTNFFRAEKLPGTGVGVGVEDTTWSPDTVADFIIREGYQEHRVKPEQLWSWQGNLILITVNDAGRDLMGENLYNYSFTPVDVKTLSGFLKRGRLKIFMKHTIPPGDSSYAAALYQPRDGDGGYQEGWEVPAPVLPSGDLIPADSAEMGSSGWGGRKDDNDAAALMPVQNLPGTLQVKIRALLFPDETMKQSDEFWPPDQQTFKAIYHLLAKGVGVAPDMLNQPLFHMVVTDFQEVKSRLQQMKGRLTFYDPQGKTVIQRVKSFPVEDVLDRISALTDEPFRQEGFVFFESASESSSGPEIIVLNLADFKGVTRDNVEAVVTQDGSIEDVGTPKQKGGIDLNPDMMNLKIRRDGMGFPLPMNDQSIEALKQIEGFLPVIINITPVQNLPMLLGFDDPDEDAGGDAAPMRLGRLDVFDRVVVD